MPDLRKSKYGSERDAVEDLKRKGFERHESTKFSEVWAHADGRRAVRVGREVTHYEAGQLPE